MLQIFHYNSHRMVQMCTFQRTNSLWKIPLFDDANSTKTLGNHAQIALAVCYDPQLPRNVASIPLHRNKQQILMIQHNVPYFVHFTVCKKKKRNDLLTVSRLSSQISKSLYLHTGLYYLHWLWHTDECHISDQTNMPERLADLLVSMVATRIWSRI